LKSPFAPILMVMLDITRPVTIQTSAQELGTARLLRLVCRVILCVSMVATSGSNYRGAASKRHSLASGGHGAVREDLHPPVPAPGLKVCPRVIIDTCVRCCTYAGVTATSFASSRSAPPSRSIRRPFPLLLSALL